MLTATVVNVALPTIAVDLNVSSSQQQWIINAYLLSIASLILVGGTLGDRYGRLRIYRVGVVWFAVASLACAAAPSVNLLIAARLLQGVGAALLTPGSLAIIESTLQPDDRGRGVGRWSGLSGVAGAIGPLVGGVLVVFSWRWVFLLNLPVAVAVLVFSGRVPESSDPSAKGVKLDVVGAVLTAVSLGAASYGLIQGPVGGFGFIDIAAIAVAVAAVAGLAWNEPRREHPIVPFDLFNSRPFAVANAVTFLVYGGMGVVFFLLSVQLQVSLGWPPIAAGAALLPVTLLMLALSSQAGALAQRVGPRWPLTVGTGLIAGGMFVLAGVEAGDRYLTGVLPGVVIFGIGLVGSVAPVTATALGAVPDDRAGAASGINNAVSRTGQLLTIAAVPPLVGLGGDDLSDAVRLTAGYGDAMYVGAVLVAFGAVVAAVFLRSVPDEGSSSTAARLELDHPEVVCGRRFHCGVESPNPVGSR